MTCVSGPRERARNRWSEEGNQSVIQVAIK